MIALFGICDIIPRILMMNNIKYEIIEELLKIYGSNFIRQ